MSLGVSAALSTLVVAGLVGFWQRLVLTAFHPQSGTCPVTWAPTGTSTSPSGTCLRTSPPSAPISSLPAISSATTTCCGCPLRHALTWVGRRPTTTASLWNSKTKPPWRSTVLAVTLQVGGQGLQGPQLLLSAISHRSRGENSSGPSALGRGCRGLLRGGVSAGQAPQSAHPGLVGRPSGDSFSEAVLARAGSRPGVGQYIRTGVCVCSVRGAGHSELGRQHHPAVSPRQ